MSNHRILSYYKLLRFLYRLNGPALYVPGVTLGQSFFSFFFSFGSAFLGLLSRDITEYYQHRIEHVFDADIFREYNIDEF